MMNLEKTLQEYYKLCQELAEIYDQTGEPEDRFLKRIDINP